MKSNKEIKNLSTDEESIKRGLKDIKEGRTFNEVQIRAISELLKIKDKEYSQKIKELENDIERLKQDAIDYFRVTTNKLEDKDEIINQLKSQLNNQTDKIKDRIEELEKKIKQHRRWHQHCNECIEWKGAIKELKSLLENELCDMSLISEETGKEYPCSFKRNHKGLHSFEDSRNIKDSLENEKGGIITIHSVEVVNPEFISKHMFPKKIPKEKRCR